MFAHLKKERAIMLDKPSLISILTQEGGLERLRRNIFVLRQDACVRPALSLNLIKKREGVRIDGGLGYYISDFEESWTASIDEDDRRIDNALGVSIHISNLGNLLPNWFFEYAESEFDFAKKCVELSKLMHTMPVDEKELMHCIKSDFLLGRRMRDYFRIGLPESLYTQKSRAQLDWIHSHYSEIGLALSDTLSNR